MGEVWKARDTRLDRIVAVKFSKANFEERFQREAHAVAALNHAHICTLYDVGPNYLVMEFVDGSPIRGPLPVQKAVTYACQILDALESAHRHGIVHRDLKPANILVASQGIKLLDFGLAKREPVRPAGDSTVTQALTGEGQIVGTLQYMAPEQLQGISADARSDIFSFGCVFYEMLTGKCAFPGSSPASVIAAILEREPAPLEVDPPLARVVRTCLAKEPDDRFQNAADLKRSVLWAAEPNVVHRPSFRPRHVVLALSCVILLGLLLAWLGRARQTPTAGVPKMTRVTQDGQSGFPSLSQDGKLLAYASLRTGPPNSEIYVQQLTSPGTVRLTNHPAIDVDPTFSADGSKVYFTSAREPAGIYEVSALGGDARLVVPNGSTPAASPDGKWLAYVSGAEVWVRSLTSGESRALTTNNGVRFSRILWEPDSSRIAVIGGFPNQELMIADVGGTKVETLPFAENLRRRTMWDHEFTKLVAWLPGNDLVFTAPSGNTSNVWRMPMRNIGQASPESITLGPLGDSVMATAQAGKLAFTLSSNLSQLWKIPSDVDTGRVLAPLQQLTHERVSVYHQDVSPDGKLLAWCSRKGGPQGIWLTDAVSGQQRLLVQDDGERSSYSHLQFSPDGSAIAAWFNPGRGGARSEIRIVNVATGQWRTITKDTARIRGWSPDGQFLLAWRRGQRDDVVAIDIATGTATAILSHPSSSVGQPRLSPGGNWLVFNKDTSVYVSPFRGKKAIPETEWIEVAQRSYNAFWSPNGRNLYYISAAGEAVGSLELVRRPFDPAIGRPIDRPMPFQPLDGRLVPGPVVNQIVATRDGIIMSLYDSVSDIWVMDLPR